MIVQVKLCKNEQLSAHGNAPQTLIDDKLEYAPTRTTTKRWRLPN